MRDHSEENAALDRFLARHILSIMLAIVVIFQLIVLSDYRSDVYSLNHSLTQYKESYNKNVKRDEEINRTGFYYGEDVVVTKGFYTGANGQVFLRDKKNESLYKVSLWNDKKMWFHKDSLRIK